MTKPPTAQGISRLREPERLDLERELAEFRHRVDDLRAFEAEYRARLIAYHKDCLRRLEAEEDATETPAPAGKGQREISCTSARTERREGPDAVGVYRARGRPLGFSPWPRADLEG